MLSPLDLPESRRNTFTDLSIDLETLGIEPGAVITQIGLAAFNSHPTTEAEREIVGQRIDVDPQSCMDHGMHVSWSTISWWLTQADDSRESMARQTGLDLHTALNWTDNFVRTTMADRFMPWGNGSTFDISLLDAMYRIGSRKVPWQFRDVRDMRTLVAMTPPEKITWGVAKVAHDAMHDAVAQAETIRSCFLPVF